MTGTWKETKWIVWHSIIKVEIDKYCLDWFSRRSRDKKEVKSLNPDSFCPVCCALGILFQKSRWQKNLTFEDVENIINIYE
jgi:hypothetical protein